jgi:putative transposase
MQKLSAGYTAYFNFKYKRSGSLFQGTFKCVAIKSDAQLLYVSAYINGNVEIHGISKAEDWPYSSYQDYLGKRNKSLVNNKVILNEFKNSHDYQAYVNEVIKNSSEIKEEFKKCLLEE